MKVMQKYFLAVVPEGEFQNRVTQLKLDIMERFHAKYALKSPAHITVKMPFVYNEAKEGKLLEKLTGFLANYQSMKLEVRDVNTFGERVIFLRVEAGQDFYDFQQDLKNFCKTELNLVDELSDRNYHPHMTIAFKDIKKGRFQDIVEFSAGEGLVQILEERQIVLLKKIEGKWILHKKIELGGIK